MSTGKSIVNMSFEEALAELEEIVKKIDAGQQELEYAIESFERGVLLKKHCEEKLSNAKLKIEQITKNAAGGFETQEVVL